MATEVAIPECQVLEVISEFLEKMGRLECVLALESNSKTATGKHKDLLVLKELCINAHWSEAIECITIFKGCEGYKSCLYELTKQWYLESVFLLSGNTLRESLIEKEVTKNITDLLLKLTELCPSKQDYITLASLLKLPSLKSHKDYSNWSLVSSRLQAFTTTATLLSKQQYNSKPAPKVANSRLVDLIAKGLLYEKCESLYRGHCGEDESSETLDLFDWMRQQPDSAYQAAPSTCVVVYSGAGEESTSGLDNGADVSPGVSHDMTRVKASHPSVTSSPKFNNYLPSITASSLTTAQSSTTTSAPQPSTTTSAPRSSTTTSAPQPSTTTSAPQPSTTTSAPQLSTTTSAVVPQPSTTNSTKIPQPSVAYSIPITRPGITYTTETARSVTTPTKSVSPLVSTPTKAYHVPTPVKSTQDHESTNNRDEFGDNYIQETPTVLASQTYLKSGRASSTPKPSGLKVHLQPSPGTSPVGTAPVRDVDTPTRPHQSRGPLMSTVNPESEGRAVVVTEVSGVRKRFEFPSNDGSIEWPSVKLVNSIKDIQAIRSVAFSGSGTVVAVGSNSRTLRLCLTSQLLEKSSSAELSFYHHSSYHKGSIYCLAWSGDTILASGSNDHKIRLLSYNSDFLNSPCKHIAELNIHSGTVRDLHFNSSKLLISGGAIDNEVKITDVNTQQLVQSFPGHTEQILTIDSLENNLVFSGGQDKRVYLWDLRSKDPVWTITASHSVHSLSVFSVENELATTHPDGSCALYNLRSQALTQTYNPHSDDCRSIRWCPEAQWLLSASYDGTICLTEPESLEWQQVALHKDKVIQVRWHPEAWLFASTGADKKACFWKID